MNKSLLIKEKKKVETSEYMAPWRFVSINEMVKEKEDLNFKTRKLPSQVNSIN